jgi:predicted DNA-binding protein
VNEKMKQVQVRLTQEMHSKLKGSLAYEGKKLVDFFNEAAEAYLKDSKAYEKSISKIIGGKTNGCNE